MSEKSSSIAKSALFLGLIAVIGTTLLAGVNHLTRDRIAEQERRAVLRQLNQIVPAAMYDNELHDDVLMIVDEEFFGHRDPVIVYRARLADQDAAMILKVTAPDGYNGDIVMLVGIDVTGAVLGVRIVTHRETPGLGDDIEIEKDDWVLDFNGRSLTNPLAKGWAVRKDGGVFDQFTGATVTPRAVVAAVQRSLEYHRLHRDALYAPGTQPGTQESP